MTYDNEKNTDDWERLTEFAHKVSKNGKAADANKEENREDE